MTIAAGMVFDNGAMICADTKQTAGMTLYDTKIYPKEYASGVKSIFAIAGSVRFARMAVSDCEKAISKLGADRTEIEDSIKNTLIDVHAKHIYPHPDHGYSGGPDFFLLVALWSPIDGLGMYVTDRTALDPCTTYDCVGAGDYLGHYIIRPHYRSVITLEEALILLTTAIQRIKAYDSNCGGFSEIAVLTKTGELGNIERFDVSQGEELSAIYYTIADAIYYGIMQGGPLDEDQSKLALTVLSQAASSMRTAHDAWRVKRDVVVAALDKLREVALLLPPPNENAAFLKKNVVTKTTLQLVTDLLSKIVKP